MRFNDRSEAGRRLAEVLEGYRGRPGVVYGLPRGGVPVAAEVASALQMPLDLVIPRKIGHPHNPEYAICAVTEDGDLVCNEQERGRVDPEWLREAVASERKEAGRRRRRYLGERERAPVAGKTAILVDDGIATGLTMEAAIRDARRLQPASIVVAVPVAPAETARHLGAEVDAVEAVDIPEFYRGAVGAYYVDFPQLSDAEVIATLRRFDRGAGG